MQSYFFLVFLDHILSSDPCALLHVIVSLCSILCCRHCDTMLTNNMVAALVYTTKMRTISRRYKEYPQTMISWYICLLYHATFGIHHVMQIARRQRTTVMQMRGWMDSRHIPCDVL